MANVLSVDPNNGVVIMTKEKRIRYKCVLSGAYVQAVRLSNVGELLDLTKVVGAVGVADQFWGPNGPSRGYALQGPGGNACEVLPGADGLHWLLKMFAPGSNNELGAGNYAANVAGDVDFYLEFVGREFD